MKGIRLSVLFAAALLAASTASCSATREERAYNQPEKTEKADGSIVETSVAPNGTKLEVRTFNNGELQRVTRITRPNGKRTVLLEYRDGHTATLDDESDIEKAMDTTAEALESAGKRVWNASKDVGAEVGDKSEDVADKAVDIAGKTADVGKGIGKRAKKVGKKIKDAVPH